MPNIDIYNKIIFVEGKIEYLERKGVVEYKKTNPYNEQLSDLNIVKAQLAQKAIDMGANAVIFFKYGQKSTSWLNSFSLVVEDDEKWYGSGVAVVISEEFKIDLTEKIGKMD